MDFKKGIVNSELWFLQAQQLLEASKLLLYSINKIKIASEQDNFRKVGSFKAGMMLLGYALENALKGKWCNVIPCEFEGNKIPKDFFPGNGHQMTVFAEKLGIETSCQEKELIRRLEIYTQWAGRYQFAKSSEAHKKAETYHHVTVNRDIECAENLIKRLMVMSGYDEGYGWPASSL